MIKIAIYSHKGGTGKTTTAFNIAGIIAKDYKKKVLVVDGDTQANLTTTFLKAEKASHNNSYEYLNYIPTFEDLFYAPDKVNEAIYNATFAIIDGSTPKKRGIDILPVRPPEIKPEVNLNSINSGLEQNILRTGILQKAFNNIKRTRRHLYDYEYCLMDLAPSNSTLTKELLGACDWVVVPTTTDDNSINGIKSLLNTCEEIRDTRNPEFKTLGVFPTICNKNTSYDAQVYEVLKESLGNILIDVPIRYSNDVKWATNSGVPLIYNKRKAPVTRDYVALTQYIVEKVEKESQRETNG